MSRFVRGLLTAPKGSENLEAGECRCHALKVVDHGLWFVSKPKLSFELSQEMGKGAPAAVN
jgi:hypothetical protein